MATQQSKNQIFDINTLYHKKKKKKKGIRTKHPPTGNMIKSTAQQHQKTRRLKT
jgi:hypothetical protein